MNYMKFTVFLVMTMLSLAIGAGYAASGERKVTRISGQVIDAKTGLPLKSVVVEYLETCGPHCREDSLQSRRRGYTDSKGYFALKEVCQCDPDSSHSPVPICGTALSLQVFLNCELDGYRPAICMLGRNSHIVTIDSLTGDRVIGPYTVTMDRDSARSVQRPWTDSALIDVRRLQKLKPLQ
jgi:hypothetical protein